MRRNPALSVLVAAAIIPMLALYAARTALPLPAALYVWVLRARISVPLKFVAVELQRVVRSGQELLYAARHTSELPAFEWWLFRLQFACPDQTRYESIGTWENPILRVGIDVFRCKRTAGGPIAPHEGPPDGPGPAGQGRSESRHHYRHRLCSLQTRVPILAARRS